MKSFISPVYINLSELTDERICIALIAVSDDNVNFDYSDKKLRTATSLLPENLHGTISKSLKTMKSELKAASKTELFNERLLNEKYFNYLSKYSHGVIGFSEPRPIATDFSEANFKKYFEMFVGESPVVDKKKSRTFRSLVNSYFKKEAFKKVDVNYKVKPNIVDDAILRPHKIDFIGKNGSIYAGNALDFNVSPETVENNIYIYKNLVSGLRKLEAKKNLKPGNYELYHNDPESKDSKELLDKVRKHITHIKLKEVGYLDKVAETLEKKNYSKFSESELVG